MKRAKMTTSVKALLILLAAFCANPAACAIKASGTLFIDKVADFPLKNGSPKKHYLISNSNHSSTIRIRSQIPLEAKIECDSQVTFKNKGLFSRKRHGKDFHFRLRSKASLRVPQELKSCALFLWEKESPESIGGIRLVKDEVEHPFLKELHDRQESCSYNEKKELSPVQQEYLSGEWPMMSCPSPMESVELLQDSKESFLTKMETLLGYRPGLEFIDGQNPYAPLDFSRTPKFKAIFLSTLLYKRDFTGATLARILKFHAKRGTLIYIMGTGYMHGEKDKALLKELAMYSPNIRVQEYKYHSPNPWPKLPGHYITNYLRDMHMKALVTLSDESSSDNTVILGGRNVHDGFLFSERPDFSSFPELNQFSENKSYAYWQDLEIKVTSKDLAFSLFAHLLKFWNREIHNQKTEDIKGPALTPALSAAEFLSGENPTARHFLSVPFNDGHALEKLYVKMIDAARSNINLSTPYLRPTKAIMSAFKRAASRGVDISIQTRINLEGDTQAWLYEETNKAAINALYKKVKLYEWTGESILHTKLITVDDTIAFFGSVNLSRRSFIQDIEHGLLIHDREVVQELNELFKKYNARSKEIDERQRRKFWASLVISILPNQF